MIMYTIVKLNPKYEKYWIFIHFLEQSFQIFDICIFHVCIVCIYVYYLFHKYTYF